MAHLIYDSRRMIPIDTHHPGDNSDARKLESLEKCQERLKMWQMSRGPEHCPIFDNRNESDERNYEFIPNNADDTVRGILINTVFL